MKNGYFIDRRFGLKPQTLYDLKFSILMISIKFLEGMSLTNPSNDQVAEMKNQLLISIISMEYRLAE